MLDRGLGEIRGLAIPVGCKREPMSLHERLVRTILRGRSDANGRFMDLRTLMRYLGFDQRVRGSHHVNDQSR